MAPAGKVCDGDGDGDRTILNFDEDGTWAWEHTSKFRIHAYGCFEKLIEEHIANTNDADTITAKVHGWGLSSSGIVFIQDHNLVMQEQIFNEANT